MEEAFARCMCSLLCLTPLQNGKPATRRVQVPEHRYTPLRNDWTKICTPIVQHLKLQIRMNLKKRTVDLRVLVPLLSRSLLTFQSLNSQALPPAASSSLPRLSCFKVCLSI